MQHSEGREVLSQIRKLTSQSQGRDILVHEVGVSCSPRDCYTTNSGHNIVICGLMGMGISAAAASFLN